MWPFPKKETTERPRPGAPVSFTNTLSGKKEVFTSLKPHQALMYSCGPTVYSQAHIGNLRAFIFSDTVARVLTQAGYRVQRVMNITDVGHMVGDREDGEDKMELSAKKENKSAQDIAEHYTKLFQEDLEELDVATDHILFPKATDYIKEQIALAHTLEEKGFAYRTKDGLYFDTSRFAGYGKLGHMNEAHLQEGARVEANPDKRHPADFALWKRSPAGEKRLQEWESPWGLGFPGWHLECSAMARSLLGPEIDIHTGGEDLAPIHHNNEIAQSEAASGRPFSRFWMHSAFLTMGGEKIAKSAGNFIYLSELPKHGLHPLALRYFFLQAHYRTPLSFSWDALEAADQGLKRLWKLSNEIAIESNRQGKSSSECERFVAAVRDDLGTSSGLGILWEALRGEDLSPEEKWQLLLVADELFGLSLQNPPEIDEPITPEDLPKDVRDMLQRRTAAREAGDYSLSDDLRYQLQERGYRVDDGPNGAVLTKTHKRS